MATNFINAIRLKTVEAVACLSMLVAVCSGCGFFGGSGQLKQLQAENDRLLSEYRAQRDRATKLQETNAALEARLGEAERLLAQNGSANAATRVSRLDTKPAPGAPPSIGSRPATDSIPPYSPPDAKWRPMRRQ